MCIWGGSVLSRRIHLSMTRVAVFKKIFFSAHFSKFIRFYFLAMKST